MKFLANENIPLTSIKKLRKLGYQVFAVVEDSPGDTDLNILRRSAPEYTADVLSKLLETNILIQGKFTVLEFDKVRQRDLS